MTFLELFLQGEAVADAGDLDEAITAFRQVKPKELSWQELCSDPASAPVIHRYRSFEAYLDNEDAIETIHPTVEMLDQASSDD